MGLERRRGVVLGVPDGGGGPSVLHFELLRDVMRMRHLTPPMLRRLLGDRLADRASVTSSEVNALNWVVEVQLHHAREMIAYGQLAADQRAILCHRAMTVLLETVAVSGHPAVTSADHAEAAVHRLDARGDPYEEREYVVHAYGAVLTDCAASECVDWTRTVSNDVWEVHRTLGIEATAHVLFDQIKTVVSFDGTYVDGRHLLMIVDTICHGGTLMPLNRHGINRSDASPLMRCSFEETTDVLCTAATYAETENARGVTSSIMMGQLAAFGSGSVDVLFPNGSDVVLRKPAARVLRSTCRSFAAVAEAETELIEYTLDAVRPTGRRSLSPPPEEDDDRVLHKRARFRPVSPKRP